MLDNLKRIGGITALIEAAIYISAFVFFGAFWDFPANVDSVQQFSYLAENRSLYSIVNLIIYVLFGLLLALLVLVLHVHLKINAPILSQIAFIFGVMWAGLVIASGMISNAGLVMALELSVNEPDRAMTLWRTISSVVEGLGGGNEIVGGLWVLLLSIAALKGEELYKTLSYLGVFVGIVGILTIYPADVLTEIFGLSQIVWFSGVGVSLLLASKNYSE